MNGTERRPMRLGIGSYAFPWAIGVPGHMPPRPMTAIDLLERAKGLGVAVVQFCDNLPLDSMPESQLSEIEDRARDLELAIEIGVRGISRDLLLCYLDLALRLRSPLLRVVIDTPWHEPSAEEVPRLLMPVVKRFEQAGVWLAIENHDRFTVRQLRDIVTRLDSASVGVCLDTVNSFGALEGPEVVISELAPYAVSLHVKDFAIRRFGNNLGFIIEGCPAGQGRLDIRSVLDRVQAAGRGANAILEQWPPLLDSLAATIANENAWAEQSMNRLRELVPR